LYRHIILSYSTEANSATTANVTLVPPRWSEIAPFPLELDPDELDPVEFESEEPEDDDPVVDEPDGDVPDGDGGALEVVLPLVSALLRKASKVFGELSFALIAKTIPA
jgi:hypothetical protein